MNGFQQLGGDEEFTLGGKNIGLTILDYWRFAHSDIYNDEDNIMEFIVANALGLKEPHNVGHWTLFDILYRGTRIEVKQTQYWHPWNPDDSCSTSQRTYDIKKANSDYDDPKHPNRYERQNDIYIFCLNTGKTKEASWPLNMDIWEFYIVPTSVINSECGDQKSVSLSRVQTFSKAYRYNEIQTVVDQTIDEEKLGGFSDE